VVWVSTSLSKDRKAVFRVLQASSRLQWGAFRAARALRGSFKINTNRLIAGVTLSVNQASILSTATRKTRLDAAIAQVRSTKGTRRRRLAFNVSRADIRAWRSKHFARLQQSVNRASMLPTAARKTHPDAAIVQVRSTKRTLMNLSVSLAPLVDSKTTLESSIAMNQRQEPLSSKLQIQLQA
jgi:hypothetical protein